MEAQQNITLSKKANWIQNPTGLQTILFSCAWLIGNTLLLLAVTDLFTESFFGKKHLVIYFMMAFSTVSAAKLVINYFTQESANTNN